MDFGFALTDSVPAVCAIGRQPIECLGDATRVPIFEAPPEHLHSLQQLVGRAVRFDSWQQFDSQDEMVKWAINAVACEVPPGCKRQIGSDHVYFAAWQNLQIGMDRGILCMPRSAMFFRNLLGVDVKSLELRLAGNALMDIVRFLQEDCWHDGLLMERQQRKTRNIEIVATPHDSISSLVFLNSTESILLRVLRNDVVELQVATGRT